MVIFRNISYSPDRTRRILLLRFWQALGVWATLPFLALLRAYSQPAAAAEAKISGATGNSAHMQRAFAMKERATASGDQAYGAVIVKNGRVVGEGPSRVVVNRDPTAHAEVEAIRDAARRLGTQSLRGCVLYATSRPCQMCETASYWANISQVYYGTSSTDAGAPRYSSC